MKMKAAKTIGLLISALVLFASCGQLGDGGETAVTINLPYVAGASRAIDSGKKDGLIETTKSYRVHMNDRVLEGTGGNFSAYFAVGLKVDIYVECLNSNSDVIVRTGVKSIIVASGGNSVDFNLMADGNEITPSAPPTPPAPPTIEYVNITFNQGFVYTNTVHQSPSTWQAMTGASLPNSGQREKGSSASSDQATATGYVFKGWVESNVQPSGDAPDAQSFNYVQKYDSDMTLYAIWEQLEPGSHSVKFAGGTTTGSSVSGLPQGFQQKEGTQATFSGTPTCPGYEFAGWNADVAGVTVTQQGNGWEFTMPTSDVTLTAQWNVITYTLSYEANDGQATPAQTETFTVDAGGANVTLKAANTFTRTGYTFANWSAGGSYNPSTSVAKTSLIALATGSGTNRTITLTAQWTAINYKIVYNGNGNTGGTAPSQVTYTVTNNNVQLADVGNLVRTNYKFLGWNTTNNATTALPQLSFAELQNHQNLQSTDANNKTLTLYAVWERVYTLTLNLNGGNWADASDNKTQYGASDLPLTLPTPNPPSTLTGYVFAGWIDKDNNYGLVGTDGMAIPSGTTGNKTYYAVFHTSSVANKAATTTTGNIEFVAVQGGTVPLAADYMPVVSNFSMSKTEITQAQWKAVMGGNLPSGMATTTDTADNNPVNQVSWFDAIAFCNKLSLLENKTPCYSVTVNGQEVDWKNLQYSAIPKSANDDWRNASCDFTQNGYRLPTEAEWEYAARGGIHHSAFTYSGSDTVGDVVWYEINSDSKTHEVRDSSKQANVLVIYDMSGNVCEWCWDSYVSPYDKSRGDDPIGGDSSTRVLRGGSWKKTESNCKVSYRGYEFTSTRADYFGLRIVCRP